VIRQLEQQHPFVRAIWLSRNFGQHAATLAGIASSGEEWVATIDEDGQYNPADLGAMLDVAVEKRASLVYADPINEAPHSVFRNFASRASKRVVEALSGGKGARVYHSFRLMLGETGRSVAAYAGHGVYLDVALGWVASDIATAPVQLRGEAGRPSGYDLRRLLSHFWRMVLTSGTRGLRAVSVVGALLALAGIVVAVVLVVNRLAGGSWPRGWASLMVTVLVIGGIILLFLGIIAEYIGVAVGQAMGRPPYLIISDPAHGPLGRESQATGGAGDASPSSTRP
jgi:undecaprenyl-phosphate 4-deoxy-4-formamido-L-arabinose transferase